MSKKEPIKSPIQPRSKEEIMASMKSNIQFQKKITFAREKFWPLLLEAAENIQDGQILLEGFNTTLMQAFLARMKEVQMKDLNLEEKLDKDSPKYKENVALLHLFDDMSVYDVKDNLEGMKGEIQQFILDELKSRPLSSLKPKWIDEL